MKIITETRGMTSLSNYPHTFPMTLTSKSCHWTKHARG